MARAHTISINNRNYFSDKDKFVYENMGFDDVAMVAIYNHADVMFEKDAKRTVRKLKMSCERPARRNNIACQEIQEMDVDDLLNDIDWIGIYNQLFSDVLEEEGYDVWVDTYGAYGWIDENDEAIFGDGSSEFPFYTDDKYLLERLRR